MLEQIKFSDALEKPTMLLTEIRTKNVNQLIQVNCIITNTKTAGDEWLWSVRDFPSINGKWFKTDVVVPKILVERFLNYSIKNIESGTIVSIQGIVKYKQKTEEQWYDGVFIKNKLVGRYLKIENLSKSKRSSLEKVFYLEACQITIIN